MQGIQPPAHLVAKILEEAHRERYSSLYWVKHPWCLEGIEKMTGGDLQKLIHFKRENLQIMKDGTQEEKWANECGFDVPEPVMKGQQTVSASAPVTAPIPPKEFEQSTIDKRSPEEVALEKLPDQELYDLAINNGIDLPVEAFDRSFTIQSLLKAKVVV